MNGYIGLMKLEWEDELELLGAYYEGEYKDRYLYKFERSIITKALLRQHRMLKEAEKRWKIKEIEELNEQELPW